MVAIVKTDRTVVRNSAYKKSGIGIRERHNERKNETYMNPDIITDRSAFNVHFKRCKGSYAEAFDTMLSDGTINTRGLKDDAKMFDELVFDVNTAYFERNGGYEYAKGFFAEAYKMAIKEAGGDQYILSAVMHADEHNKGLSEELGRDVFHYHLHVVYVPVVEKAIKWTKRCKNKSLVGTVKEVVMQVSHSKKWVSQKAVDENGKTVLTANGKPRLIPSYSLLQDRFFEHMRSAGFEDIERGERGSTAEHLTVLDFKVQEEQKRVDALTDKVAEKSKKLSTVEESLQTAEAAQVTVAEVETMGKRKLSGKVELTPEQHGTLTTLAKEGLASRSIIQTLKAEIRELESNYYDLKRRFSELWDETRPFREATMLFPKKVLDFLYDLIRQRPKQRTRRRERERTKIR
ncbi:plasmid recombination protein [Oscillospiraceae bacterium OttesenSCG-928-F05]|nr:plasmid recombination protein [Oscillospiraceae bacterium OttesenSCG-928-F05]